MQTPEEKLLEIIRKKEREKENKNVDGKNPSNETDAPESSNEYKQEEKDEAAIDRNSENEINVSSKNEKFILPDDPYKAFWGKRVYRDIYKKFFKNFEFNKTDFAGFFVSLFLSSLSMVYILSGSFGENDMENGKGYILGGLNPMFQEKKSLSEVYGNVFSSGNLFASPPKRVKIRRRRPIAEKKTTIDDLKRGLVLVGVTWDSKEKKAILEKKGRTIEVKVGDNIDGLEVIKIEENKIHLRYNDETAVLGF